MLDNKQKEIIEKVRKLFALAKDAGSDFEAQSAALKAQELLDKYDLEIYHITDGFNGTCEEQVVKLNLSYFPYYINTLLAALSNLYVCSCTYNQPYKITKKNNLRRSLNITFMGVQPDVTIAIHTFHFLTGYAKRKAKNNGFSGKEKTAFMNGFAMALLGRFKSNSQEAKTCEEKGLCVIKNDIVERYMKDKYPDIKERGQFSSKGWSPEYELGVIEGKNVQVNQGIKDFRHDEISTRQPLLALGHAN